MAIGRPKAIDDAPAGRGPHRACAMGWPQGRSEAEDGGGETFLPREEWANRGPHGAGPVGWKAQGKKVDPPPLRLRRSRRSRPSARSSHGEAMWSARRTASSGEDVADTERLHKSPGFPGDEKETPWFEKGQRHDPAIRADGDTAMARVARPGDIRRPERSKERLAFYGHADEPLTAPNSSRSTMRTAAYPSLVAPPKGNDAGPPAPRRSTGGGANSDMRAHAVPPTRIAPTIANAPRQPSDGTPIWASPSVAW